MCTKNKKVIFIGGSSYSGSTMLDMMMANSSECFSVGEVHALFRPYRPHHFNPSCGCGNPGCDFWEKVHQAGENNLYKTIFTFLPEVTFIVDSSKDPWWIKKQTAILKKQGMNVCNLLIYKEPAAFAHSMLKRNRNGWKKAWKNYYRLYFSIVDNYISVAYSQLAQHSSTEIRRLCQICGLEFHNDKEKFWKKQHHTLFGNDSAKIHLYSGKSESYKKCNDKISTQETSSKLHQSIYYDDVHKAALPADVLSEIKNDQQIGRIESLLNNINDTKNSSSISYSPLQLFIKKKRHAVKALLGRLLGRYWRLF